MACTVNRVNFAANLERQMVWEGEAFQSHKTAVNSSGFFTKGAHYKHNVFLHFDGTSPSADYVGKDAILKNGATCEKFHVYLTRGITDCHSFFLNFIKGVFQLYQIQVLHFSC